MESGPTAINVMKILFQGDSITDAFRKPGEVNQAFQLGNGYAFLIASRIAFEYPQAPVEFINRGLSGNGVGDLLMRWQQDAVDLNPDVISILIGVNDVYRAMHGGRVISPDEFSKTYRELILTLRAQNPKIEVVIVEPFLLEAGEVKPAWKMHLRGYQKVIRRIAEDFQAVFIPLQSAFDASLATAAPEFWAFDGVHPTHAGFELIAREWLKAVEPILANEEWPVHFRGTVQQLSSGFESKVFDAEIMH
jgi:lysophospholipase L1-like esterase